jgi:hypothetical protein
MILVKNLSLILTTFEQMIGLPIWMALLILVNVRDVSDFTCLHGSIKCTGLELVKLTCHFMFNFPGRDDRRCQ